MKLRVWGQLGGVMQNIEASLHCFYLSIVITEVMSNKVLLTGQVSVTSTGLPTLLDSSLGRPGAQRFAGAAEGVHLSAQLRLTSTTTTAANIRQCSAGITAIQTLVPQTCLSLLSFIICPIWNWTKSMKSDLEKCSKA